VPSDRRRARAKPGVDGNARTQAARQAPGAAVSVSVEDLFSAEWDLRCAARALAECSTRATQASLRASARMYAREAGRFEEKTPEKTPTEEAPK